MPLDARNIVTGKGLFSLEEAIADFVGWLDLNSQKFLGLDSPASIFKILRVQQTSRNNL